SQDTFFVRNQMRYAQEANSWINGVTTTKNAIVYGDNGAGLDSATLAAMAESAALQVLGQLILKDGTEGNSKVLVSSASGAVTAQPISSLIPIIGAFVNGGNSFGGTAVLGTSDNNDLQIKANNNVVI